MKVIIETFVTIIFLGLTVIIATQVIGSQITINGASSFHTNAVQVIEESNFDDAVIEECIEMANVRGYELVVDIEKSTVLICSECNSTWGVDESSCCVNCNSTNVYPSQVNSDGVVTLTYDVEIAMLGIKETGSLQSNAR